MVHFVLVAGARLGARAWDDVVPHLRSAGRSAHPLTLSGLAELSAVPAGQQTHVQDIVDVMEHRDLQDVVLVGHSYSGIPVGQAAQRIGPRLAHVVFVDSCVPTDGEAFIDLWPDGGAAVKASIAANGGFWPPAPAAHFDGHGLTDAQLARLMDASTPHPGATLLEPAVLARPLDDLPATYVQCLLAGAELPEDVAELLTSPHWQLIEMSTGHWPMFSQPRELARILLEIAGR